MRVMVLLTLLIVKSIPMIMIMTSIDHDLGENGSDSDDDVNFDG